jgi:hypothetical protein
MTKFNKLTCFTIFIIAVLTLKSCTSSKGISKKYLTVEKGAIPAGFGNENTVLLVYSNSHYFNKRREKALLENYNGDYEFVYYFESQKPKNNDSEMSFIRSIKYNNTNKYRYIFSIEVQKSTHGVFNPVAGDSPSVTVKLIDRKEGKTYQSQKVSANYFNFCKEYFKKLDEQRIINKG